MGGQRHILAVLPSGKRSLPIVQDAGPQGRSRQVQKPSSPPGFDPRAAKPVASRYTNCITLPHTQSVKDEKRFWSVPRVYCGSNQKQHEKVIQNCPFRLKFETCSSRYRYFTLFGERSKALPIPTSIPYILYALLFLWPLYRITMKWNGVPSISVNMSHGSSAELVTAA